MASVTLRFYEELNDFLPRALRKRDIDWRILLTRDRALLMHRQLTHGGYLHCIEARRQLAEVVERYDLYRQIVPFNRCMVCNGIIVSQEKAQIEHLLAAQIVGQHDKFWRCDRCQKIYWMGSHYNQLLKTIAAIGGKKQA